MKTIGILGAMAQEIDEVKKLMTDVKTHEIGGRTFFEGFLEGKKCVVAFSKWGKVAATMTSVILITVFKVDEIVDALLLSQSGQRAEIVISCKAILVFYYVN